ncbi:sugar phosphate isomerase/epimerase family protein [Kroppenstedtia eburnea]|uniref:3-dehydroshikimate dehydratase n=1 Tax=Kroppenstedtia eburnea TaxID=714067 RepID=A0A1N7LD80_9BACL|nr:sugar phosphate isomerase/epimerase family protein [Kroppenstedtia eburnea]QKI81405.1 sugar phosphate isomerase/epimerase [Kroppenstedtia eburnea]SIS71747.1 3-dehydroshikimate dehydratase [Kroppenstedtia eburnea]
MLKWSLCSTGFKDRNIEEVILLADHLGLQGVEIWTGHIRDYLDRNGSLATLGRLLQRVQLSVPAVSGYTYFSKGEQEQEESLASVRQAMEWAGELDCPLIRTFAGHTPSREVTGEEWRSVIAGLKQVMETAESYQVNLGLELHNNTCADRIESVRSLLSEVDHPRLRLIFDGFNLFLEGTDQMEAWDALHPWVDHIHLKNYLWNWEDWQKSIPTSIFAGDVDHRLLVGELQRIDYPGFVSFEYFGDRSEQHIRNSMVEMEQSRNKHGNKKGEMRDENSR